MDQTTIELYQKIDRLAAQVQYLTDQAQRAERVRQERDELPLVVLPTADDTFQPAATHLRDIEECLRSDDLVRLLKKLARARPYLEILLDQLQSGMELLEIAGPIGKEGFARAETMLDSMDRKGYFVFAKGGLQIVDNIVSSFSAEDVRQLGDNIVLILRTVREMTQPEVMNLLRNTIQIIDPENTDKIETSIPALLGQLRDPNVRRGLALTMRMLQGLGTQQPANGQHAHAQPGTH